ncbi:MAG: GNAT family N-acetyltransferase [Ectobacillus sp.]
MIREIDITKPELAQEVLRIQIPAYKAEAELIVFYDIPPLKDTVEALQACGETFYGYYLHGDLGGIISLKIETGVMDIQRLVVHPKHFRKGIAKKLLEFAESAAENVTALTVSTGSKNTPAVQLYKANGFVEIEKVQITEGLSLSRFIKNVENVKKIN